MSRPMEIALPDAGTSSVVSGFRPGDAGGVDLFARTVAQAELHVHGVAGMQGGVLPAEPGGRQITTNVYLRLGLLPRNRSRGR